MRGGENPVRSKIDFTITKGQPIRKWGVRWGVGNLRAAGIFFHYQIPCMIFFLGYSINIFQGLIGVYEFFLFNFPLHKYFFGTSLPPPHKFSNGLSLW